MQQTLPHNHADRLSPHLDLSLVIPVYNEADGIASVLTDWHDALQQLGIRFEILAFDDGSSDESFEVLQGKAEQLTELSVVRHRNRGHGPTIIRGYQQARGEWVAQTDSDGEISASEFVHLWSARHSADLHLGSRLGRGSNRSRRSISAASRFIVRGLFGAPKSGIKIDGEIRFVDVNTPFRLMQRQTLEALLEIIPEDTFAPNLALTGLAARQGKVHQTPVHCRGRQWGTDSLRSWKLWRNCALALKQTTLIALSARLKSRSTH